MSISEQDIKIYKRATIPNDTAWDKKTSNPYVLFERLMYEHARYTWLHTVLSFILFDRVSNIKIGLTNIWFWFSTIWKDRNWDEYYILKILQRKIEIQRNRLVKNNRHEKITYHNRDMTIVLNLLERVMHDYYDIEHYNYIDINYSFDKNPDNSETYILNTKILSENLDIFISKYPSSARYVLKHNPDMDVNYQNLSPENKKSFCRLIATHNHKKARALLFNIINERAPSWWD